MNLQKNMTTDTDFHLGLLANPDKTKIISANSDDNDTNVSKILERFNDSDNNSDTSIIIDDDDDDDNNIEISDSSINNTYDNTKKPSIIGNSKQDSNSSEKNISKLILIKI